MEEYSINDLIDQFLLGKIRPEDNQKLQQLIASDPEVHRMVEESKLAYQALEAERRRQLKNKLITLDHLASRPENPKPKWPGILLLLSCACIFYLYMATVHYSPKNIAERNYIAYKEVKSDPSLIDKEDLVWQKADEAFKKGEFQSAIQQYAILSESSILSQSAIAKWNILLAQLALEGPGDNWKIGLENYQKTAPEALSMKAKQLQHVLASGYYRFFSFRIRENLSPIKPRLI